jgi:hypothetical protein
MIDKSLLRVAITPQTQFLLQGELKAISQGLEYIEDETPQFECGKIIYKGYVKDGKKEGVGIEDF